MSNRNRVFLDTSGWIALLHDDDEFHARATEELDELGRAGRALVTTDWVLAETGNSLSRVPARRRFRGAVDTFMASPKCRVVRVDMRLFDEALDLYDRAADKRWGLVDCASFVLMQREEILDAFTTDHHFQQAGFRCLLVSPG